MWDLYGSLTNPCRVGWHICAYCSG